MSFLVVLTLLMAVATAAPPFEFSKLLQARKSGCWETYHVTIITTTRKMINAEWVEYNVTSTEAIDACCKGYRRSGSTCVKEDKSDPCQSLSCRSNKIAQCTVFKKCGQEIALFMEDGKIVEDCHEPGYLDVLSCSGLCIRDPCLGANCSAFNATDVMCFSAGCDCQATWIHKKERAQVNCLSGEIISLEESQHHRRRTLQ